MNKVRTGAREGERREGREGKTLKVSKDRVRGMFTLQKGVLRRHHRLLYASKCKGGEVTCGSDSIILQDAENVEKGRKIRSQPFGITTL